MKHYKLIIQYKGTGLFGWQIQTGSKERTVQSELNRCLKLLSKSSAIKTIASGRTDAGVHALGQVVKASISISIPPVALLKGLNSLLPPSINVLDVSFCDEEFHPVFHAKNKEYIYCFSCGEPSPLNRELISNFRYELDYESMAKACEAYIGEHDFKDFYCVGTPVNCTKRIVFECSLTKVRPSGVMASGINEYYEFRVLGSGFMKQMVRLMVGTLWSIGRGKVSIDELELSLRGLGSRKLGAVAPPEGLYLKQVNY